MQLDSKYAEIRDLRSPSKLRGSHPVRVRQMVQIDYVKVVLFQNGKNYWTDANLKDGWFPLASQGALVERFLRCLVAVGVLSEDIVKRHCKDIKEARRLADAADALSSLKFNAQRLGYGLVKLKSRRRK